MQLEDHLGDILRKARQAAGLELKSAAQAAGLSETDIARLESSGVAPAGLDYSRLAALLGLSAERLERIAQGWLPPAHAHALERWRELRQITTTQASNTVHCYLVWDEITREAALFDTGFDAEPLFKLIRENELNLRHLFLTHLHDDHVAAMGPLRARFPKLLIHTNSRSVPAHQRTRANDFIQLGSLRIMNRETPGHTEEGVIYVVGNWPEDAPHVALVGDTIFAGSIATGFQSTSLLKQKIVEQIFSLPADTLLGPGHGPMTTVADERENNPFFGPIL